MWPDRVSNPGPLTYESGALPTALRGPAQGSLTKEDACRGTQAPIVEYDEILTMVTSQVLLAANMILQDTIKRKKKRSEEEEVGGILKRGQRWTLLVQLWQLKDDKVEKIANLTAWWEASSSLASSLFLRTLGRRPISKSNFPLRCHSGCEQLTSHPIKLLTIKHFPHNRRSCLWKIPCLP